MAHPIFAERQVTENRFAEKLIAAYNADCTGLKFVINKALHIVVSQRAAMYPEILQSYAVCHI